MSSKGGIGFTKRRALNMRERKDWQHDRKVFPGLGSMSPKRPLDKAWKGSRKKKKGGLEVWEKKSYVRSYRMSQRKRPRSGTKKLKGGRLVES